MRDTLFLVWFLPALTVYTLQVFTQCYCILPWLAFKLSTTAGCQPFPSLSPCKYKQQNTLIKIILSSAQDCCFRALISLTFNNVVKAELLSNCMFLYACKLSRNRLEHYLLLVQPVSLQTLLQVWLCPVNNFGSGMANVSWLCWAYWYRHNSCLILVPFVAQGTSCTMSVCHSRTYLCVIPRCALTSGTASSPSKCSEIEALKHNFRSSSE